jgi:hypothetical protein
MKFLYKLSDSQYDRFQQDSNTREIQILGKPLGVFVQDGPRHDSWTMTGSMEGGAFIEGGPGRYQLTVIVINSPWWAFRWLLDAAFHAALK